MRRKQSWCATVGKEPFVSLRKRTWLGTRPGRQPRNVSFLLWGNFMMQRALQLYQKSLPLQHHTWGFPLPLARSGKLIKVYRRRWYWGSVLKKIPWEQQEAEVEEGSNRLPLTCRRGSLPWFVQTWPRSKPKEVWLTGKFLRIDFQSPVPAVAGKAVVGEPLASESPSGSSGSPNPTLDLVNYNLGGEDRETPICVPSLSY